MDKPIEVSLPDGSTVDIRTKEGTNEFLRKSPNFRHYSSTLKKIKKLRYKKKSENKEENETNNRKIRGHYESINCIASNADRELYADKVPKSEIEVWLKYVIDVLESYSKNRGPVHDKDDRVLLSCVMIFQSQQPGLVSTALDSDVFRVLADVFRLLADVFNYRQGWSKVVATSIAAIALNTLATATLLDNWSLEKIFNKFQEGSDDSFLVLILQWAGFDSGIIKDYDDRKLRFMWNSILGELESCPGILARAFENGKPCRVVLNDFLKRETIHPDISTSNRIKGIAALVNAMDSTQFEEGLVSGRCATCRRKTKANSKLRSCGRCDFIFYCSRECQKADWGVHKYSCKKLNTAALDRAYSLRMNLVKFMNRKSHEILEDMDLIVSSGQVELCDLVVEISFMPDENGMIPALQNPPISRVFTLWEYALPNRLEKWFPDDWDTELQRTWLRDVTEKARGKATFGTLVVYHAGRIHVDIGILEQYRNASASSLDDVQLNLGTTYCCSTPVTVCQKYPKRLKLGPK